MKQLPGVSRLVLAVAAVLALSLAAGASASWPVSQMEATTLWREGRSWLIEQDPWSCGMVWMNQTRGGESTYRIKSFAGADPLCSQPEQLWVGLFAKDGNAEPKLFDMNCNNLPTIPASMHSDGGELLSMVVPGVDVVKHSTSGRQYNGIGIRTNQTVFLMVVNVCGAPLLVEVEQEVHLQFWRWLQAAKPQLASLGIIAAATAAIVVSAWNLISMCQAGSVPEEEQEQEDEATVPLVTKDFGCGAATQTCGDAQCQTQESPLTAFLEQTGAKSSL